MCKLAAVTLAAVLICLSVADAGPSPSGNPWTVVKVREPRPGDVPFENASNYLRPSEDANNVPGPDSLVAHMRTDEQHHAYIEVENLRTGTSLRLHTGNSCLPQWSPDGKYIACVVWKSRRLTGELAVANVDSGSVVLDPGARASVSTMKWSPDGRRIAVEGTIHSRPHQMLYTVSFPEGKITVLDTVGVLANYEFSWSPDGRWIVFSRPTKLDDLGEATVAADLWIADVTSGGAWPLLQTPDWIESNPLWITNRTIQVDRVNWDASYRSIEQCVVVELSQGGPSRPPQAIMSGPMLRTTLDSLKEDFEGVAFPPAGWSMQTAGLGLPYAWHRTTDSSYVGKGLGAALVGGESPSAIDEWLISPAVSLADTGRAIKFLWSGSQMWSSKVNASLSIRRAGTSDWTLLWSLANDEPPANPFVYRERVVDLTAWRGRNVEFGFRVAGTNGADFALDDIVIGDFTPTGAASNDVCSTATRLGSVFSIKGVTCYAANDLNPFAEAASCVNDELDGPDIFYEIGAEPGDSLHASVTAQWGAALYLLDGCANPVCLAGGLAEDARTAPIVDYKFSTLGSYYLVVDGEAGSCGPFQLDGQIIHTATGATGR